MFPSSSIQPRGTPHTQRRPDGDSEACGSPLPSPRRSRTRLPSGSSTLLAAVVGGATGISVGFGMGGRENQVRRCYFWP